MTIDEPAHPGAHCPQCLEPAVATPPTAQPWADTWTNTSGGLPHWSHADGQPLCPVVGEHGYEPAPPVMSAVADDDDGWEP